LATPVSALVDNCDDDRNSPAFRRSCRDGKKAVIAYFRPDVNNTLRHIAINENTTMQALVGEAINLLVTKRGLPPFDFED
jgi:hypothetical protein